MIKQQHRATALLCRLSREDELGGDSESIQTQKKMLTQYANQNHFTNIAYYVDDGYSGTNFERPDFQRLLSDIKAGKISTVITKDLSRLGRDYLKTGYLLENFFPEYNVRFIAINDDVDSSKGIPELTPFKNIMNEWYARDISKKIRSAYRTKAMNGEFTAAYAPYGYKKDPKDKHHLIPNEETAPVVRRIFQMACENYSAFQICVALKRDEILKPRAQITKDSGKYYRTLWETHPFDWSTTTICGIIANEEYLGHLVCNKNSTSSYKSKKLLPKAKEEWIIKRNTHEPLVDEELYKRANEVFFRARKRKKKTGERNMFSGLLRCSDCGKALSLYSCDKKYDSFCCVTYRSFGKSYCSAHYTIFNNLYEYVLNDIKKQIRFALTDREEFIKSLIQQSGNEEEKSKCQAEKEIRKKEHRLDELQKIEKRMYEDLVLGRITDDMYGTLSLEYENEKKELKSKLNELYTLVNTSKNQTKKVEDFVKCIEQYTDLQELNPQILNALVHKIVVHEREFIDGVRTQKIDIEYNFLN